MLKRLISLIVITGLALSTMAAKPAVTGECSVTSSTVTATQLVSGNSYRILIYSDTLVGYFYFVAPESSTVTYDTWTTINRAELYSTNYGGGHQVLQATCSL